MQEEVDQKTIALAMKTGKLTGQVLQAAMKKFLAARQKGKTKLHHGQQSLRQLKKDGSALSNIEITDANIGLFRPCAKKYDIDYTLRKDSSTHPPRYIVIFKTKQADNLEQAFKEFTAKKLSREERPSIRKTLCTFLEVFIMGVISLLFSVEFSVGIGAFLLAILLVFLAAFFISGMAYGISLILPNEVVYETVMNAIVLPLFFLSTALFPAEDIDGVLGVIVNLNPFTHIINALRSLLLDGTIVASEMLFVIILFIAMAGISFGWAIHRLNRETAL